MDLATTVTQCLEHHGLLHTPGVVAVSGGPDSVALAYLLIDLLKNGHIPRLILGHVNHQLRGGESDADEIFVQQLPTHFGMADDPQLSCKTTRIAVAAIADAESENLESVARRERYAWLTELAAKENAAWMATGHSADDQAETVLFRLIRSSGVLGLAGMRECRPLPSPPGRGAGGEGGIRLLRPLLSVRRPALYEYLRIRDIPYRVDSSNLDRRFARNRIRLDLLPELEAHHNPAIVEVLCRLAEQAGELHAEAEQQARELLAQAELPRAGDILVFAAERLQAASANQVREMFRLVWQREAWPMGEMDFTRWHRLAEIASGQAPPCDFPGRIHAQRIGKVVQVHATGSPAQPR